MKQSSLIKLSVAALTAATFALPVAAANDVPMSAKCGAKCAPAKVIKKNNSKCGAKCAPKCGAKCAPKCAPKCGAKCAPKCGPK